MSISNLAIRSAAQESATLTPLITKLQLWKALDASEQRAVLQLPHTIKRFRAGDYIVKEGDEASNSFTVSLIVKRSRGMVAARSARST